jgi:hypothetical protein
MVHSYQGMNYSFISEGMNYSFISEHELRIFKAVRIMAMMIHIPVYML